MKNKLLFCLLVLLVGFHFKGLAQTDTSKVYLEGLRKGVEAEQNPQQKEKLGLAYIQAIELVKTHYAGATDYAYLGIGLAYAKADRPDKALEYANKLTMLNWVGEGRSRIALVLLQNKHLEAAGQLLKKAVESTEPFLTATQQEYSKFAAASGYKYYCTDYADVLYRQGNYPEALKYIRIAHHDFKQPSGKVNTIYLQCLVTLKRYPEAFEILDESVKNGQSTAGIRALMQEVYLKAKGSLTGYDQYAEQVKKELYEKAKLDLSKQMIRETAPKFVLKDLDGHTVSLDSLKGKIVVLDFWATWCGPCKASFPAMQMAVNRYKNDPDVRFYFIHTMEYNENATEDARQYIKTMKYPFTVLMDLKEKGVKGNKVVDSFKTSMIPAKFVIDGQGNLRFRMIGYHEGDDATLEQITAMVELAKEKK